MKRYKLTNFNLVRETNLLDCITELTQKTRSNRF